MGWFPVLKDHVASYLHNHCIISIVIIYNHLLVAQYINYAIIRVGIWVFDLNGCSNDMVALCYACGLYIPMDEVGSHDKECSASEEEKRSVFFHVLLFIIVEYPL